MGPDRNFAANDGANRGAVAPARVGSEHKTQNVRDDMQSIFGAPSPSRSAQPPPNQSRLPSIKPFAAGAIGEQGSGLSLWSSAGMAAVAIIGIAGIYLAPPAPPTGPVAQTEPPAAQPSPQPVLPAPQPFIAPTPAAQQQPAVHAAPVDRSPPAVEKPKRVASKKKAKVQTAAVKPDAPPRPTTPAPLPKRCEGMDASHEAWCLQPAVRAADQQLRDAYANAIRNGVARSTLVSYRKRWSRIRNGSSDEPRYLIGSYYALAEELQSLSAQAQSRGR